MTTYRPAILFFLASATLSGCSAGSGTVHPQCKDATSTQDYAVKWQEDLAEARHSGRLTMQQVVDAQGKTYSKLALLKDSNWSGYCDFLDSVRKETGF